MHTSLEKVLVEGDGGGGLRICHRPMVGCVGCRQVLEERVVGSLADPGPLTIPVVVVGIIGNDSAVMKVG